MGNIEYQDAFNKFDKQFFKKCFWVDKKLFYKDLFYHIKILFLIRKYSFNEVIHPVFSRERDYGDYFIKFFRTGEKIGFETDISIYSEVEAKASNKYYNVLIKDVYSNNFEFIRNKFFVEKLLNTSINISAPAFNIKKENNNSIVIFPGKRDVFRRWDSIKFSKVINYILINYSDIKIIIVGGNTDIEIANKILINVSNTNNLINLCGKTTIIELIEIINRTNLVISNETVAVHIAASTNTNCICLSNGTHYFRFNPYPSSISKNIITLYPDFFDSMSKDQLFQKYRYFSDVDINLIIPQKVINNVKTILK
ncbi:MAG: hypothetical protein KAT68_15250 [Bacteroidales bacterium]|nr:hypothetical protein [Bacteroidales bacterium]